ncbi:ornithine carbamoyltransferase [Lacticaseibacillus baoqingensis]|uniref:Ornithine carbamoyltransferase n=1 Tax=Lacticaseibacillus baoqingensis TaxID=2486013 RepID=A0ABW4E4L4_9LACO|nr:ornithine carbamoyltransferase [Lacticaseibacillus baoqingensis]
MNHFQNHSFLKEIDFTPQELEYLIDFAGHLKGLKQQHIPHPYLQGKNIALLFEKTSTRTRSAFTVAAIDLGAHPEFLGKNDIQFGKKESTADTAQVLGRMFDGIEYRGFAQETVETLAKYSGVPVWNGLTDEWHPTQMIADFLTLKEQFGHLKGLTLAYFGDGRSNMGNSLIVTAAMLGVNFHLGAPKSLWPAQAVIDIAQQYADQNGSELVLTQDAKFAAKNADAVYTDVWISMGEDVDPAERIQKLKPYQINAELVAATGKADTIIMHCLPAYHDHQTTVGQQLGEQFSMDALEITDDVFTSPNSVVFTEAENRMHAIKAIMAATLGDLFIPDSLFA